MMELIFVCLDLSTSGWKVKTDIPSDEIKACWDVVIYNFGSIVANKISATGANG